MKLSIIIPARNEEGSIAETITSLIECLRRERIPHEIIVVDDGSSDQTKAVTSRLSLLEPSIRVVSNEGRNGFGMAIRFGIPFCSGDAIVIMMADGSDSPEDLVSYHAALEEGYECVFGSRFVKGGRVFDYPLHKLWINRAANTFIRLLFGLRYNDVTNAFKCYRREVIESAQPLISPHFNLTVELPLKAIVRGCSYKVIPIQWTNRKHGVSKLKLTEMGSRYLFIVLYLWLEKYLSRGDYRRHTSPQKERAQHV